MTLRPNPYPLRLDKELLEKFKIVAKDNGRSVNKEIEMLVKQSVSEYEEKHGFIQLPNPSLEE